MTKYDQRRKDDLAKTLAKAKEQAEKFQLYLTAGNANIEELSDAHLVLEDINNALKWLGALVPEGV